MCDPLTLGSLAIGAAGTAANAIGQNRAAKKQEQEYNSWAGYQKNIRAQENTNQEQLRQKAAASQAAGVEAVSADAQKNAQAAEKTRLEAALSGQGATAPSTDPAAPTATVDKGMLSGQQYGGDVFQSDLAKKLSDAAASAKQRIGALATVGSYGGSFGGLGTVNPINQAQSGAGIDLENEKRRGSLAAYGTERAVDPMQISYSNPIADVAQGFLGAGMQGVGQAAAKGTLGSMFGKALTKAGPVIGGSANVAPSFTAPVPIPRPIY